MRIAVVGRGMVGSAAARHLTKAGAEVVLIGPGEPVDPSQHRGVFSSHYDSGRVTRQLDSQRFWSDVSRASIARYAEIEAASGIRFYHDVGGLHAAASHSDWMAGIAQVQADTGIPAEKLTGEAARGRFPEFHFPSDWTVWAEHEKAGYIDPRALVEAQTVAAQRSGAQVIPAQVDAVDEAGGQVVIRAGAEQIKADRAVLATGGFAQMLVARALPLRIFARTLAFFELDAAEQARLARMPAMVTLLESGNDPYFLPPIRYPDGRVLLKIGGDPADRVLRDLQDMQEWFRSGGSDEVRDWLADHLLERMPNVRFDAVSKGACVTTFTPNDRPIIDRLSDRLCLAVAGCGRGAKCSDELGRLASALVLGQDQSHELSLEAMT